MSDDLADVVETAGVVERYVRTPAAHENLSGAGYKEEKSMRTMMSRESLAELVSEAAACVHRVAAADPIYRHNKQSGDRALNFLDDLPWDRTRERTLADLVAGFATDPLRSDAPKRLEQVVSDGHLGRKAAWHVLGLAVGGFSPDLVVAYLAGPKPARLTDSKEPGANLASGNETPGNVSYAYLPDAETDPDNPVSRVAMTLRVESDEDWKACRAEVSRIIDRSDDASEWDVDLAIRLAAAMEEFERRDAHAAGGQTAMPMPGPRSGTDRELLERAIERTPLVTEEQKRRLRLLADGTDPDAGVTE